MKRLALTTALLLASCGGGGGGGGGGGEAPPPTPPGPPASVYSVPAAEALSVADVQKVIAQAAGEATARGRPAVIAVTDRVGNVLAVFQMTGAQPTITTRPGPNGDFDAQGVVAPAAAGAIAKAITGAYLSSGGNAFSTRTASMIVQEHFPPSPATAGLESGPLYGVQFSQLPCSDLSRRFTGGGGADAFIGPKRSPLGLAADPGGFPLYKNGVLVGGVGVIAESDYGFDRSVSDIDNDAEEHIALAATNGFGASTEIRGDRVSVDGTTLRYSDATSSSLQSNPGSAPAFGSLSGSLVAVNGYHSGAAVLAGQTYGTEASGIRKATGGEFNHPDAFILTNGSGTPRYAPRAGTDAADVGSALTAAETRALLEEAFAIMSKARAQIRRPLDSRAQVTISVVDTRGAILGVVRAPDAPMFGVDVSVQKARTANFFSGPFTASALNADPDTAVRMYLIRTRNFLNDGNALTGGTAFSARAVGNLHRPYFPDGEVGRPEGPLSRPISQWSPFATGMQSRMVAAQLGQHLSFVGSGIGIDAPAACTNQSRLGNGMQIFPGAVPIYRGGTLVGAIGVSGDGIDQDDMTSFLGLHNGGVKVGGIGNAPTDIRADQIVVSLPGGSARLRYVNCPFSPFLGSSEQNVCQGK
ncbi:MAG TPA: heme-binding protein [Caulobacteraceae bacterium]|nr:heme-binding protein [Caulobacteraceae bacterium]